MLQDEGRLTVGPPRRAHRADHRLGDPNGRSARAGRVRPARPRPDRSAARPGRAGRRARRAKIGCAPRLDRAGPDRGDRPLRRRPAAPARRLPRSQRRGRPPGDAQDARARARRPTAGGSYAAPVGGVTRGPARLPDRRPADHRQRRLHAARSCTAPDSPARCRGCGSAAASSRSPTRASAGSTGGPRSPASSSMRRRTGRRTTARSS